MKYMGSKRAMLLNGLGEAIDAAIPTYARFVDMFAGSGSVAWHVAQRHDVSVLAADLQTFAVVLSDAVLLRTEKAESNIFDDWVARAREAVAASPLFPDADRIQKKLEFWNIADVANDARAICVAPISPMVSAYGGYYYSPLQSIWLDALRSALPEEKPDRAVCLAALIWAASRCAAAPGHTAQPFKPNATAGRFLAEAWRKDVPSLTAQSFERIAAQFSKQPGTSIRIDANELASHLREGDLAFLDPPYSGVHYSRFYHVLETLATNEPFVAEGTGRYPPPSSRPQSAFSTKTASIGALKALFEGLSRAGASAIVTFPAGEASNGLSGDIVRETAADYFQIKGAKVTGRFSTLGGNMRHRDARMLSEELILTLTPR